MSDSIITPASGVNLFGYSFAESGVGELLRQTLTAVKEAGLPYSVMPYTRNLSRQKHPFDDFGQANPDYPINIVGVNADEFPNFARDVGQDFLNCRYTIGIWAWEIEEFPTSMAKSAELLDEIWAISCFTADAIRRRVNRPVYPYPLPIAVPNPTLQTRQDLGLPEGFMFLFCFDFDSVFARKNPIAVIDAFRLAFPSGEQPILCLKSINGERHPEKLDLLNEKAASDSRITHISRYWDNEKQRSLMASCDAYVSLHRAEGFGLTMAEAMAMGKPVIATAYSGNLDFMTERNSFLVPAERTRIPLDCDPYPAGAEWADPSLTAAAESMKQVYTGSEVVVSIARQGRTDIEQFHGSATRSKFIRDRIEQITRDRASLPKPSLLAPVRDQFLIQARLPTAGEPASEEAPVNPAEIALQQVLDRIQDGPDLLNPSRLGKIGLLLRRSLYRLLRNYDLHQRQIGQAIVLALREVQDQSTATERRLDDLEKTVADLHRASDLHHRDHTDA